MSGASLQRRIPEALSLHERAVTLNPSLAMAWALSGFAHLYAGDLDEAQRRLERYRQLSPADPFAFLFDVGQHARGVAEPGLSAGGRPRAGGQRAEPRLPRGIKPYLAALGHVGRAQEAALVRRRRLSGHQTFSVRGFMASSPFARAEDTRRRRGVPSGRRAGEEPAQAK